MFFLRVRIDEQIMCVRLQDVHSESAVSIYIYVLAVLAIHETDK